MDWSTAYPWFLGLFALLLVAVLAFTLFPRLERVRATEDIHQEIERLEVEALVKAGGSMLQKDITYELGFSRVKTHRTMVKLLKRGVVTAEKYYNTNRIQIADWLKPGQRS
jgi:uncharacterized membrane protein